MLYGNCRSAAGNSCVVTQTTGCHPGQLVKARILGLNQVDWSDNSPEPGENCLWLGLVHFVSSTSYVWPTGNGRLGTGSGAPDFPEWPVHLGMVGDWLASRMVEDRHNSRLGLQVKPHSESEDLLDVTLVNSDEAHIVILSMMSHVFTFLSDTQQVLLVNVWLKGRWRLNLLVTITRIMRTLLCSDAFRGTSWLWWCMFL